jgi:hypothetical protein
MIEKNSARAAASVLNRPRNPELVIACPLSRTPRQPQHRCRARKWSQTGALCWVSQSGPHFSVVQLDLRQSSHRRALENLIVVSSHSTDREAAIAAMAALSTEWLS